MCGFIRISDARTVEGQPLSARRFGLIDDLVVAQDARRRGVAERLFVAVEEWARSRGLPALEATIWAFNEPIQEMCEKHGFGVLQHYVRKRL